MKTPLITVDNLCMDFDGKRVLKNISFEIGEGEILGIIGRSGAGKTVLMHLIRGVEQPPTSGRIIYHVAACGKCDYLDLCGGCRQKAYYYQGDLLGEDPTCIIERKSA